MKKKSLVLTLLIGFSAILFNSCSKSDSTPATTTSSPVAGTWTRSNGSVIFSLALKNDYSYSLTSSGTPLEAGSYTIAAPAITFNASTASISGCSGKPGKYNYNITTVNSTTVLTFTLVSDSCSNRSSAAVGPWNKQ